MLVISESCFCDSSVDTENDNAKRKQSNRNLRFGLKSFALAQSNNIDETD